MVAVSLGGYGNDDEIKGLSTTFGCGSDAALMANDEKGTGGGDGARYSELKDDEDNDGAIQWPSTRLTGTQPGVAWSPLARLKEPQ